MTRIEEIKDLLNRHFPDAVFRVEDDVVWVSGMNSTCRPLAERMAHRLQQIDVPCGLVYEDGAGRFGGVQFNWGESA